MSELFTELKLISKFLRYLILKLLFIKTGFKQKCMCVFNVDSPALEPPTSRSCTMTFTKIFIWDFSKWAIAAGNYKHDKVNRDFNQSNQYCPPMNAANEQHATKTKVLNPLGVNLCPLEYSAQHTSFV